MNKHTFNIYYIKILTIFSVVERMSGKIISHLLNQRRENGGAMGSVYFYNIAPISSLLESDQVWCRLVCCLRI